MEAGLRPGHSVRWGPSSPQKRGTAVLHPFFGPCLLWANGRMDQDATWYRGRPRTRPECVRWEPQNDLDGNPTPPQKGHSTPTNFWSMSTVAISATAELLLHSSRQRVAILYNGRPLSPLKLPLHTRDMDFNKYVVPLAHQSSQSKQHLDRFSCSCSSHYSDRQN